MTTSPKGAPALVFENTHLDPVIYNGQIWLIDSQIAAAMGYTRNVLVRGIYAPIAERFTPEMTAKVKLSPEIRGVSGIKKARIFSLHGAVLLAGSIEREIAKRFVLWLGDILDGETPKATSLGAPQPIATSDHKKSLLYLRDVLSEARHVADFVQSITLIAGPQGVHLTGGQITGLYYVMSDLMDRIKKSEELLADYESSEEGTSHD